MRQRQQKALRYTGNPSFFSASPAVLAIQFLIAERNVACLMEKMVLHLIKQAVAEQNYAFGVQDLSLHPGYIAKHQLHIGDLTLVVAYMEYEEWHLLDRALTFIW